MPTLILVVGLDFLQSYDSSDWFLKKRKQEPKYKTVYALQHKQHVRLGWNRS